MKLLIASNNKGKWKEIQQLLGHLYQQIFTPADLRLTLEVEENGETFLDNARAKAHAFAKASEMHALADDSGLCVDALEGAPGVFSARFSGKTATDEENNAYLLRCLQNVPAARRQARFVCCVVLATPQGAEVSASGICQGEILFAPRGEGGFGYDPLFFVPALGKSFAELTRQEKNQISHRGRALIQLEKKLEALHGEKHV